MKNLHLVFAIGLVVASSQIAYGYYHGTTRTYAPKRTATRIGGSLVKRKKAPSNQALQNLKKEIGIKSFCGHKFGEVQSEENKDKSIVSCKADHAYFGGYDKLELKYAPSFGLFSVMAKNDDAIKIGDLKHEAERLMALFEERYKVKCASKIDECYNKKSNGFSTKEEVAICEEFKDVKVEISGSVDFDGNKSMSFSIEQKALPSKMKTTEVSGFSD